MSKPLARMSMRRWAATIELAALLYGCAPTPTTAPAAHTVAVPVGPSTPTHPPPEPEPGETERVYRRCAELVGQVRETLRAEERSGVDRVLARLRAELPRYVEKADWCEARRELILELGRFFHEGEPMLGYAVKDAVIAYEREDWDQQGADTHRLCPSAEPIPDDLSKLSPTYASKPEEWSEGGWDCLRFAMKKPQFAQIMMDTEAERFVVRIRRRIGDSIVEVSLAGGLRDYHGVPVTFVEPEPVLTFAPIER